MGHPAESGSDSYDVAERVSPEVLQKLHLLRVWVRESAEKTEKESRVLFTLHYSEPTSIQSHKEKKHYDELKGILDEQGFHYEEKKGVQGICPDTEVKRHFQSLYVTI